MSKDKHVWITGKQYMTRYCGYAYYNESKHLKRQYITIVWRADNCQKFMTFDHWHSKNQSSTVSKHVPSFVKIHWYLLKLLSGNKNRTDVRWTGRHTDGWTCILPVWNHNTSNQFSEKADVPQPWIFIFSTAMTLKIRSRSPKSNHFFFKSQLNIHKTLVRI